MSETMSKEDSIMEKIRTDVEFDYKVSQLTPEEIEAEYEDWLKADNPFDLLTDSERAEYEAWNEEVDAQTPDPLQCKCGKLHGDYSHPEGDYDLCLDCQKAKVAHTRHLCAKDSEPHMPFDSESDYDPDIPFLSEPETTDDLDEVLKAEGSPDGRTLRVELENPSKADDTNYQIWLKERNKGGY